MDIIQKNPYRFFGVYSNSPIRERVANHNRLKAFLKVGKSITYPLDLSSIFPSINKTIDTIADADAKLALPNDQLKYAQFWFLKITPLDDIALNHLLVGNIDTAISIWEKKQNVSSLQNRIVCALIQKNYTAATDYAQELYLLHEKEFVEAILGKSSVISTDILVHNFLDALSMELDIAQLLSYISNQEWKEYISAKSVSPLIEILQTAINAAKASKKSEPSARLSAGVRLMDETKDTLKQLQKLVISDDLQYQMIADKLGTEILQCGIDYFNGSDESDVAHKAMELQGYALSIVIGKMAKDRCKENVDILNEIIENLPPLEVFSEDKAIREELKKFCQLPDKIVHAVSLLNNTQTPLQNIKVKLGVSNTYYLKTSTQVVGNALHNIIEEVNDVQKPDYIELDGQTIEMPIRLMSDYQKRNKLDCIKSTLQAAWNAIKKIETFDMEADFKSNRYYENKRILQDLCTQFNISTSTWSPRSSSPVSKPSTVKTPSPTPPTSSSSTNSDNVWLGIKIIAAIIIFIVILSHCH